MAFNFIALRKSSSNWLINSTACSSRRSASGRWLSMARYASGMSRVRASGGSSETFIFGIGLFLKIERIHPEIAVALCQTETGCLYPPDGFEGEWVIRIEKFFGDGKHAARL